MGQIIFFTENFKFKNESFISIRCMNTTSSLLSSWVLLLLHNQPIYVYGGSTCSLHVSWEPHFASHFSAKWKEKKYCFSLRMQLYDVCQYKLYIINCNLFWIFWTLFYDFIFSSTLFSMHFKFQTLLPS